MSFSHFKLNHNFMCPPHLSAPNPKLTSFLVFSIFVKGVNVHSHLSQKPGCWPQCLLSYSVAFMAKGCLLTEAHSSPLLLLPEPRFPLGNYTPTLYLLVVWVGLSLSLAQQWVLIS